MNNPAEEVFATRPAYVLELPLKDNIHIIYPDRVILKIGSDYKDIGACCYALRSKEARKPALPADVVLPSLRKQRRKQILQAIKVLSAMMEGKRTDTVQDAAGVFKNLMDWADANGHPDCLAGGEATRIAFRAYAADVEDRLRRQEIGTARGRRLQIVARDLLKEITGIDDLDRGVKLIREQKSPNGGTEPAADHDFAHLLAISEMLFDGLCRLVLDNQPFPYKLDLPASLGWEQNHLWLFPTQIWRLPPHLWGAEREKVKNWAYDYQNGRLATVDEIWHRYSGRWPSYQRVKALVTITQAQERIDAANSDARDRYRVMLGMLAHNAFCLLFQANTGSNLAVVLGIETDGTLDDAVANQGWRQIKFRASAKTVPVMVPVSLMPRLRRYMELRAWLLDEKFCPYLFFTFGRNGQRKTVPEQAAATILNAYSQVLQGIDPNLTPVLSRQARATMDDWLLRNFEAETVAAAMGHTKATELTKYGRGSSVDHRDDMTLFLTRVSAAAKRQKVIPVRADLGKEVKELEEGGGCARYGHPEGVTDDPALQPHCAGGCWFCAHRMLVADEEDARKLASAVFVMEHLVIGPQHEHALRPLIQKCEEDLERIAATGNCDAMVRQVKKDVHEEGNLTSYWAEKYQLFLELEIIS